MPNFTCIYCQETIRVNSDGKRITGCTHYPQEVYEQDINDTSFDGLGNILEMLGIKNKGRK